MANAGASGRETSDEEVRSFAKFLGAVLPEDEDLLWIAKEALTTPLPPGWSEHVSSKGEVYFYNEQSDESTHKHPLEEHYSSLFKEHKARRQQDAGGNAGAGTAAGHQESSKAQDDSAIEYVRVSPDEIVEFAAYYGADPRVHWWALRVIRQALLTPLPGGWREVVDRHGQEYYYHEQLDQSTRTHPVDSYYRPRITNAINQGPQPEDSAWMVFVSRGGAFVYHNFETGATQMQRPISLPQGAEDKQVKDDDYCEALDVGNVTPDAQQTEGQFVQDPAVQYPNNSPRDRQIAAFLQGIRDKVNSQVDAYKTQNLSSSMVAPASFNKDAPPIKKAEPTINKLAFYAWWFEEGQRRYLELQYGMHTHSFKITLDKTVVLKDVKIAARGGRELECWDLYIGQKIDVLGKPTTLMQANLQTMTWLDYHAERMLKRALALEKELLQYKPVPTVVYNMVHTTRTVRKGSRNLRWIMLKSKELEQQLQLYRTDTRAIRTAETDLSSMDGGLSNAVGGMRLQDDLPESDED